MRLASAKTKTAPLNQGAVPGAVSVHHPAPMKFLANYWPGLRSPELHRHHNTTAYSGGRNNLAHFGTVDADGIAPTRFVVSALPDHTYR